MKLSHIDMNRFFNHKSIGTADLYPERWKSYSAERGIIDTPLDDEDTLGVSGYMFNAESFESRQLPDGVTFAFADKNNPYDNLCLKSTIIIPIGNTCSWLYLLGFAEWDDFYVNMTVLYEDDSEERISLFFPNFMDQQLINQLSYYHTSWTNTWNSMGVKNIAAVLKCTNGFAEYKSLLYNVATKIENQKTIKAFIFEQNELVHIYALSIEC